jgi:hypothetical protein
MFSLAGIKIPGYIQGQPFLGKNKADKKREYVFAAADRLDTETDMIRISRNSRYKYFRNFFPEKPYYLPVEFREQMLSMQELLRMNQTGELNDYQSQWFRSSKPEEELFDIINDPYELHNIAGDPVHEAILTTMRNACGRWMNETGDLGHVPESELIDIFWPGRVQPRTDNVTYVIRDQTIFLECKTPGAGIGYQVTPLGSPLSPSWEVYLQPVKIRPSVKVTAIAHRIGFAVSDTLRLEFR